MPVCPNCKYEYIEGVSDCPDCGVSLENDSSKMETEEQSEENWKIVYTSNNEYEIEMIKDNLEGGGIKATILSYKDRNFPTPGDFSQIKLLVRENDLKDAEDYINETKKKINSEEEQQE